MHESIVFCTACRMSSYERLPNRIAKLLTLILSLISWQSNTVVLPRCKESSRSLYLISWWVSCHLYCDGVGPSPNASPSAWNASTLKQIRVVSVFYFSFISDVRAA